jgi:enamine deaminase RidA (YjgF/YER057c/UK114 family)
MSVRAVTSSELGPVLGMYSHGVIAGPGEIVVVAGQVGRDASGNLSGPGDVAAQTKQALANVDAVLRAAGCSMRDVVRFQTFLTDPTGIEGFMRARREAFPQYFPDEVYPPNTLVVVSRLVQPELLVEIEAMAVRSTGRRGASRRAGPAGSRRTAPASRRRGAGRKRR